MLSEAFFTRPCPTCNRSSRILLNYLGMKVRCRHCGRVYEATDPEAESAAMDDPVSYWLNFTDQQISLPELGEFESNRQPR